MPLIQYLTNNQLFRTLKVQGKLQWTIRPREAAKQICKQRYIEFGCEGQAPKIKGHTLQVVAAKYEQGELAQTVN